MKTETHFSSTLPHEESTVSDETAKKLLRCITRIRMVEESISKKYPEGKMRCPVHLSTGQEGVSAAAGVALEKSDFAVSTHRGHGHYLGKGGSLQKMLAELYGKKTGCSSGKGGSMHLIDQSVSFMGTSAIVGGTIPIGVGLGLSIQLNRTNQVSCIFLGEGATEEGVFYESVNFAAVRKLPVLFLCENNLYSVYSPLRVRQPENRKIHELVSGMGIPSQVGNGNHVIQTYSAIKRALNEIRRGSGPQFLEFSCYRWREHCGPNFDNHIGYRTESEFLTHKEADPLSNLEKTLLAENKVTRSELTQIQTEIEVEILNAFEFAECSPFPSPDEAFTQLFASENEELIS